MKISIAKKLDYTKYGLEEKSIYEVLEIIQRGDMQLYDSECGYYDLRKITEAIRNQRILMYYGSRFRQYQYRGRIE